MAVQIENALLPAEEQRERLEALYRLALEIAELRDPQQVLDTALRHCLDLTASQFGFIGLRSTDGRTLDVVAIQGFQAGPQFFARNHLIPLRPSIFARAVLENRPVRSLDAMHDENRVGQPTGHPPVGAFLGVPLRLQGAPIGMIGVANRATHMPQAKKQPGGPILHHRDIDASPCRKAPSDDHDSTAEHAPTDPVHQHR